MDGVQNIVGMQQGHWVDLLGRRWPHKANWVKTNLKLGSDGHQHEVVNESSQLDTGIAEDSPVVVPDDDISSTPIDRRGICIWK